MGIRGLTKFIQRSSYLEDFELQDTDLIIDGSNLCYPLLEYAHCNPAFGGDYDKYEQTVSDFFDRLLECHVKPLVFLHGGTCISKIPVYLERYTQRIRAAFNASPVNENGVRPLLLKDVFIQVLKMKDIPHAQCLMEADDTIAAVAKALNCPVLSGATYFYLYGVLYIPIDTLIHNVMNHLNDKRKMIPCKIYKLEHFLNSFEGLNQHNLSLLLVLLSNDNKKLQKMVRNTVSLIEGNNKNKYEGVPGEVSIVKILHWLCKYTLEDAITEIMKEVPTPMRLELLKIIETNINKYTNPFAQVFTHLSIPEECFASPTNELYRYKGNIESLPFKGVPKEQKSRVDKQREKSVMLITDMLLETQHDDSAIDKLPQWFKDEFKWAILPDTYMMMIKYHFHTFPALVEDFSQPPSCLVAMQIFKVIYGLLTWVTEYGRKFNPLTHLIRCERRYNTLNDFVLDSLIGTTTVPLSNLRGLSLSDRKAILDAALGIKNVQFIDEILPQWQLYIACLQYWKTHQLSICDNCHIYSILTFMIYKLVVSKIGYYNSLSSFEKSNNDIIKFLQKKRDKSGIKLKSSTIVTVAQACKEIDSLDCLLAAPFFISHSEVKPELSYGPQFNRDILHAFAQFQFAFAACIDLNAILGFPYKAPHIAMLYTGTLLYNLCVNFQICENMETYKDSIFKNSPSLLKAFNVLFKFLLKKIDEK